MGTSVFTWRTRYGAHASGFEGRHDRSESSAGTERVRAYGAARFVCPTLDAIFTDTTAGASLDTFRTFWITTLVNGADSFLFKDHTPANFKVEGEAGGTSSGAPSGETFTTAKKFIAHTDFGESATTLIVKVDGVAQTITTDYTVSGNGTAPTVTATANFDTGAVTFDYSFYYQVRGRGSWATSFLNRGTSLTAPGAQVVSLSLREVRAGGHLA